MATPPPATEPCPVCGARGGGTGSGSDGCPLFPQWASEAKVLYFFEAAKRGQALPGEVRAFWAAALAHYLRDGKRALSFAPEELGGVFTRRGLLRPLCLARVAAEADARGETARVAGLSPEAHAAFVAARGVGGQQGAGTGPRLTAVVRWALRTLVLAPLAGAWSLIVGHDELAEEEAAEAEAAGVHGPDAAGAAELREPRAHVGLLQEVAAALAQHFTHRLDAERTMLVVSPSSSGAGVDGGGGMGSSGPCTLREACQAAAADGDGGDGVRGILEGISDQDCFLLADFLVARGLAARDGLYLKLLGDRGSKKTKQQQQKDALTEADKKVLDFRMQVRQLEAALARREADMLAARQRAVALHKQGRAHQAAVELARSKRLGAHAGKLQAAVLNLLSLHYSIEGVAADVAVFEGLRGGSAALAAQRAAAARAGLGGVRDVDEAMAEARELVAGTQEMATALARSVRGEEGGEEEEEEELLRELEALEREQEQQRQHGEQQALSDLAAALPDVSHLPPPRVAAAAAGGAAVGEGATGRRTATGVALSS